MKGGIEANWWNQEINDVKLGCQVCKEIIRERKKQTIYKVTIQESLNDYYCENNPFFKKQTNQDTSIQK